MINLDTKFNKYTVEFLIKYYRQGYPLYKCASRVGISNVTLSRWLKEGKNLRSSKHLFYLNMKKAREDYLQEIRTLRESFKYLHRFYPEEYPPATPQKYLYHKFNHD